MPIPVDRDAVQRLVAEEAAQVVEVLPLAEYEDEHIAGAISMPLKELDEKALRLLDRSERESVRQRVALRPKRDSALCWAFRKGVTAVDRWRRRDVARLYAGVNDGLRVSRRDTARSPAEGRIPTTVPTAAARADARRAAVGLGWWEA
jgi:rhodanese-related sulfurtransferase